MRLRQLALTILFSYRFRFWALVLFVPVYMLLNGAVAFAQPVDEAADTITRTTEEIPGVILATEPQTKETGEPQLEIRFDSGASKAQPAPQVTLEELKRYSELMRTSEFEQRLEREVVIPLSTANGDFVESLSALDSEKLGKFLQTKNKWLKGLAKTLTMMRLRPRAINKVLIKINDRMFENATVVLERNSYVVTFGLGNISAGAGLSSWMTRKLLEAEERRLKTENPSVWRRKLYDVQDRILKAGGFYYLAGAGVSLGISKRPAIGRWRFFLEGIFDWRAAESISLPFVIAAAGFYATGTIEIREEHKFVQKSHMDKVSFITVLSGKNMIGGVMPFNQNLIPFLGLSSVLEGSQYRFKVGTQLIEDALLRITRRARESLAAPICRGLVIN